MAFEGYLFKIANTTKVFPHQYIELSSWKSTPNQREEIKAYRDENTRNLTRVTAAGKKSVFSFTTRPNLHLRDKKAIQAFFAFGEALEGGDATQRKIQLTFWNEETNTYESGYFYRPNMEFPVVRVTRTDIIYGPLEFSFVEY